MTASWPTDPKKLDPYPNVASEQKTIEMCLSGFSLARLGDGELKIIYGAGYAREPPNSKLGQELRGILLRPDDGCLVGIPTMDPQGAKYANWLRHRPRFSRLLMLSKIQYYSAFVTRPDSSPWIRTSEFASSVERLWRGRNTVVVCEKHGSIFDTVRLRAGQVRHVMCPRSEAYAKIDEIEQSVVEAKPDVVIISAGPTATCLANRLAARNIQAIDLGSSGRWIGSLLGVTRDDKKEG